MDERLADQAVAALRGGDPIVLPTDTVYGLCAYAYRAEPVRRLSELKRRDPSQPIALIACDLEMLFECVPELLGRPAAYASALLPGPLTLILPNPAERYRWLTGSRPDTIGVRVPKLAATARAVLDEVGAVAGTSANLTGQPDPRVLDEVPPEIRDACGALVDGGELPGTPSTVVDLTGDEPKIVREGPMAGGDVLARLAALVPQRQ